MALRSFLVAEACMFNRLVCCLKSCMHRLAVFLSSFKNVKIRFVCITYISLTVFVFLSYCINKVMVCCRPILR